MKKLILGVVMIIGVISFSSAQKVSDSTAKHSTKKATATRPATTVATVPKPATTAAPAAKPAPAKPAAAPGVVLKKDSTPDKGYKNATAKGPAKKDDTPDKRYKANKKS